MPWRMQMIRQTIPIDEWPLLAAEVVVGTASFIDFDLSGHLESQRAVRTEVEQKTYCIPLR